MNRTATLKTISGALALTILTCSQAFAAETNKIFISGWMILLFLGFCALVVAIQLIPAIKSLLGMVKDTKESSHSKATVTAKGR